MDTPAYVEFRIGDYQHEFGILNSHYLGELGGENSNPTKPSGVVVYWHVDDVDTTLDRLISMDTKEVEAPRHFGQGFIGASVVDPFGNLVGIMYNPHYLEILDSMKQG
jgi:predicted enzyme related to lactoylglutathione lyase